MTKVETNTNKVNINTFAEPEPSERTNFTQMDNNSVISTCIGKGRSTNQSGLKKEVNVTKSSSSILLSDFANHTVKTKPKKPVKFETQMESNHEQIIFSDEEHPREEKILKANKDDIVNHNVTSQNSKDADASNIIKNEEKLQTQLLIIDSLTSNLVNATEINTQQSISLNKISQTRLVVQEGLKLCDPKTDEPKIILEKSPIISPREVLPSEKQALSKSNF